MALFGIKIKPLKVLASVFCSQARHDREINGLQRIIENLEDALSVTDRNLDQVNWDLEMANRDLRAAEMRAGAPSGAFAGLADCDQGQIPGAPEGATGGPTGPGASGLGYSPLG